MIYYGTSVLFSFDMITLQCNTSFFFLHVLSILFIYLDFFCLKVFLPPQHFFFFFMYTTVLINKFIFKVNYSVGWGVLSNYVFILWSAYFVVNCIANWARSPSNWDLEGSCKCPHSVKNRLFVLMTLNNSPKGVPG